MPKMSITRRQVFVHVPFHRLGRAVDFLAEHALQPEIYFSAEDLKQRDGREAASIAARLGGAGLGCTLHAPFMDLNPGAVDPGVRKLTLSRYLEVLEAAALFRPGAVVFHPGYDRWRYDGRVALWREPCAQTFRELLARAEKIDPPPALLVENIFDGEPGPLAELIALLDHPLMGFCFDTGHFLIFSRVSLETWMDSLGGRLEELHLHDNDGMSDAHLPPGRGKFPFERIFSRIGKLGKTSVKMTLEAHSEADLALSVDYLSRRFKLGFDLGKGFVNT